CARDGGSYYCGLDSW
nr:immunoglobulin heavy chain junction region [Macaca mulatta]